MKRFLALAVGLMLLGATGVANAGGNAVKWVYEPLVIRTTADGTVYDTSGVASGNAVRADTSLSIAVTSDWALPNQDVSAMDSTVWAALYIKGRAGSTTTQAFDSAFVDLQVSIDNSHWVTVTPTRVFYTGSTNRDGAALAEQTSQDAVGYPIKVQTAGTGLNAILHTTTAPSALQVWGWPFARFIIRMTAVSQGQFVYEVGHWKNL